jgi:hypothetical protein
MRFFERRSDPEFEIYSDGKKNMTGRKIQMPSVQSLISGKEQKIFIKKLFDNDTDLYRKFIEKLEKVDNWVDTFKIIEEEFSTRNINPRSHEASLFTDFVFRRFYPE